MVWGTDNRQVMQAALEEATNDEYRAQASYAAVLAAYGPVQPFVNIHASEGRHIAALAPLFARHGLALPADGWAGAVPAPASLAAACQGGIDAEIANYQMYDRLMATVDDPVVIQVFARLRHASHDNHLPAFRACLAAFQGQPALPFAAQNPAQGVQASLLGFGLGAALGAAFIWWLGRRDAAGAAQEGGQTP